MILSIIKVVGHSLHPTYEDGDFVLVSKLPIFFGGIQVGDTIVFRHPTLGKLIKIVERVEDEGRQFFVIGLDPLSRDSRTFGAVARTLVLGKVIGHIRKR
ncbi:MAG: S26 family signal peptidase [Anaerolineaceae bacterium]|nr:S26 family signal peptidase [Anaerolineaceae bacterium]